MKKCRSTFFRFAVNLYRALEAHSRKSTEHSFFIQNTHHNPSSPTLLTIHTMEYPSTKMLCDKEVCFEALLRDARAYPINI